MAVVNVDTLGMREVEKIVIESVANEAGTLEIQQTRRVVSEIQPRLNGEEAALLADMDWVATKGVMKMYGKFQCMAGGRRFFADAKPIKPSTKDKDAKSA